MAEPSLDQTRLASLQPAPAKEMHYSNYKNRLQLHGSQFMALKRPSRLAEFGREYVPGDPVNLIDWKAFARTDQLIVREVRDESAARVSIGVDLSATMYWPNGEVPAGPVPTKAELALRLALHLAYGHLRMGDQVEVWLHPSETAVGPSHLYKPRRAAAVLSYFAALKAGGFGAEVALSFAEAQPPPSPQAKVPGSRQLCFWVGDALGSAQVAAFLRRGRCSLFLHTLSSLELTTDWLRDGTSYFDQGAVLKEYLGQGLKLRSFYLQQLTAWCDGWRQQISRSGGDYLTVSDQTPISVFQTALAGFIKAAGIA